MAVGYYESAKLAIFFDFYKYCIPSIAFFTPNSYFCIYFNLNTPHNLSIFLASLPKIKAYTMKLAIIVPCYNEELSLPLTAPRLISILDEMTAQGLVSQQSYILFVNDGSTDSTWSIITSLHSASSRVKGLNLVSNAGQQNAILAGIFTAVANEPQGGAAMRSSSGLWANGPSGSQVEVVEPVDAVITIDADLQDPLECIPEMVRDFNSGYDVVYGVRSSRKSDSAFKRLSAESFYRLQSSLGLKTVFNHADFRLMSRRVVLELRNYDERNLYLRGIIPLMGYPYTYVEEERQKRNAGESKYSFAKMLALAFDGISSFSIRPMYLILALGALAIAIAIAIAIYVVVSLCSGNVVPGWTSLMLSIWLVGGMVMISIGLVGLYVGKVYLETKHRPRYHISDYLD